MGSFGALAGHILSYWVAHPGAAERQHVLESFGHGYTETAVAVALVACLVALVAQFFLGYLSGHAGDSRMGRGRVWVVLAVIQLGAFVSVEVVERVLNGVAGSSVLDEPAFWLGLPLQVVVAGCGAALLKLARKIGARAASSRLIQFRGWTSVEGITASPSPAAPIWVGFGFSLRAPPRISLE